MKPSKRQQAIFDCWETEDCNILINAVAGSGKTTTLMQLLERSKTRTLFVAFNKTIQVEIQERIDTKGMAAYSRAMTMHSLGLSAIKRNYKFKIDTSKGFKMVKMVEKHFSNLYEYLGWQDKSFISSTLIAMNDVSRMFLNDDYTFLCKQLDIMGIPIVLFNKLDKLWDKMVEIRTKSYDKNVIDIDFADMIYLPLLKDLRIPVKPINLMVDECQDLNIAQHALIDRIIEQGDVKKWIAVGDPNQSIYGFAGANPEAFDLFKQRENVKELPLDICYRCPPNILEKANEVYDVMEGFKTENGNVGLKKYEDIDTIPDGALVICRNTAPLIRLFFELLGRDRKVFLKGDDVLGTVSKFLYPYLDMKFNHAIYAMEERINKLEYISGNSHNPLDIYKLTEFNENFANFKIMVNYFENRLETVSQLLSFVKTLFAKKGSKGVTLCTIHKSKGLENETVYILEEKLIPSPKAKTSEMKVQEYNLKYVARTRASKNMYFLSLETDSNL